MQFKIVLAGDRGATKNTLRAPIKKTWRGGWGRGFFFCFLKLNKMLTCSLCWGRACSCPLSYGTWGQEETTGLVFPVV